MEIESWRQAVNYSKYDGSMKKSITIPIDFRYSPPGYPADEPGFRRIKVTGELKKNLRKMKLERANQHQGEFRKNVRKSVNGVDFQRLTTDVAAMSMDYDAERRHVTPSNVEELSSTWKQNWPERVEGGCTSPASPRLKSGRGYRMVGTVYNKKKISEVKQPVNDKEKLNRNDTKMTSVSSRGSTNSLTSESTSDKNEYRTCSNDLLNVISIDDFRMRHKTFQQPIREDSETSLLGGSQKASETRSARGQGYPSRSVAAGSYRPGSTNQRRHLQSDNGRQMASPTESGYDSQLQNMYYYDEYGANETVNKAFDSILCGDNAATNSHAHRGLFKYESRAKEPAGRPKESKRFRRLNRALHDWIENEIVIPHQATRGWYLSSSGSYHATQSPTNTTTSQGHRRSTLRSEGQSDQDNGGFLGMVQEMDETNEHQPQAAQWTCGDWTSLEQKDFDLELIEIHCILEAIGILWKYREKCLHLIQHSQRNLHHRYGIDQR